MTNEDLLKCSLAGFGLAGYKTETGFRVDAKTGYKTPIEEFPEEIDLCGLKFGLENREELEEAEVGEFVNAEYV